MNGALELAGVALAALLSENMVLVTCTGIGTHRKLLENCEVYREIAQSQLSKEELA